MPEISLMIDGLALEALTATFEDMTHYEPRRLPNGTEDLLRRSPEAVVCLTKFPNGKYRIGGDFVVDYITKRTGGARRELRASNVDPETGADNTGENSFN